MAAGLPTRSAHSCSFSSQIIATAVAAVCALRSKNGRLYTMWCGVFRLAHRHSSKGINRRAKQCRAFSDARVVCNYCFRLMTGVDQNAALPGGTCLPGDHDRVHLSNKSIPNAQSKRLRDAVENDAHREGKQMSEQVMTSGGVRPAVSRSAPPEAHPISTSRSRKRFSSLWPPALAMDSMPMRSISSECWAPLWPTISMCRSRRSG